MKKAIRISSLPAYLTAAVLAICMFSCKVPASDSTTATGRPYEMILSIDQQYWDSELGDTIRAIFLEPVQMLNQPEPMFDMMRINPSALQGFLLQHRNLMVVKIGPEFTKPTSSAQYNTYSRPQVIVTVAAPNAASMTQYLSDNRTELQTVFEKAERERTVAASRRHNEATIEADILDMFGMNISIPKGYKIRNTVDDDFMWISMEQGTVSQGIVIYSYPYGGRNDFLPESLLERRNDFVSRIPGPSDNSYMITSEYIDPEVRYLRIRGRSWAEMRGMWDVRNDFMGGPFVSFATLDNVNARVVVLDFYVFSPRQEKRNYVRSLEHLVYSVSFASDQPGGTAE